MSTLKAELIDSLREILPYSHDPAEIKKTSRAIENTDIPSSLENAKLAFDFFDCVRDFEKNNPAVIKVLNVHSPRIIETFNAPSSPKPGAKYKD